LCPILSASTRARGKPESRKDRAASANPRETAEYGREADLKVPQRLFDAAKSGEGQVALIEGEAEIGKSRLVDELIGRLQTDGEDLNFLFGSYPLGGAACGAGAFSTDLECLPLQQFLKQLP
jgi:predicted ATPase